jgi:tRNA threonylcarbamoyladenosine biosynthesis protein TsaE
MKVFATRRTESARATRLVAKQLATLLRPGDVLLLIGDLGAGKTTFVQGLADGLGVTDPVTSPTFTLMRVLECKGDGPVRRLLHADLYRLDQMSEVVDLGLVELVEDESVAAVEWGDAGAPVLGTDVLEIELASPGDEDERTVTVSGSESWESRAARIVDAVGARCSS